MKPFNQIKKSLFIFSVLITVIALVGGIFLIDDLILCFKNGQIHENKVMLVVMSGLICTLGWGIVFSKTFESFKKEEKGESGFFFPVMLGKIKYLHLLTFWSCLTLSATGLNKLFFFFFENENYFNVMIFPFLWMSFMVYQLYEDYARTILTENNSTFIKDQT